MKKVVIVGGGITGLAAAYRLRKTSPEVDITIIEPSSQLGGKVSTDRFDGFVIESGPDCFLARKPRGIGLCEELGIADQLVGRDPNHAQTFVLRHGRLHPLPAGLTGMIPTNLDALMNCSLLSDTAVSQIAQEPNLPPQPENGDESVAHFISRRLGQEAFDNLIEPLMGGIYAGRADQLSLAATFPHLRQLELKHGSLLKGLTAPKPTANQSTYPPFVSFPDGMQTLVGALAAQLDGVEILLETAVAAISVQSSVFSVQLRNTQHAIHTDAVILTTPAFVSSQLLRDFDPDLAQTLDGIPYASSALVNLVFAEADVRELDGYGYVIPRVEGREALACTWTSRKWQNRAPQGKVLLRVYIGRYGEGDVTEYEDGRLLAIAQNEIKETLNITAQPEFHRIIRYPKAMPQYNMGHLDRIAHIRARLTEHPGLFMAGGMFNGVGIPDCILSGETAVKNAIHYLQKL